MFGLNQYESFEIFLWTVFFGICLASVYAFFLKDLRLTQDQKETDFYFYPEGLEF